MKLMSCAVRPTQFRRSWQVGLIALICLFAISALASNPSSGTLTDANPKVTYTAGPFVVPNPSAQANSNSQPTCNQALQCDTFTLNVTVAAGDASTMRIRIQIGWPVTTADFDLYVFDSNNNLVGKSATSADPENTFIPAVSGTYTVEVAPFDPQGQSLLGQLRLNRSPPAFRPALEFRRGTRIIWLRSARVVRTLPGSPRLAWTGIRT